MGNRLRAVRNEVAVRYVYDPWGNLLAEANDQNQLTRRYVYGLGLIAIATPSARYCYHFDPTGNTVAVTDASATVVNSYAYEPFGLVLAEQEAISQPFKFVGRYGVMAEPEGLYYMRARYYDPSVGRFISEDPIGFAGGDENLFAYVKNNPANQIDPSGLQMACPAGEVPIFGGQMICGGSGGRGGGGIPLPIPPFPITEPDNPPCESRDKDREKRCDDIYHNVDIPTCRQISKARGKAAGARCYATAAERYSACLSGRPMPPLDSWNN